MRRRQIVFCLPALTAALFACDGGTSSGRRDSRVLSLAEGGLPPPPGQDRGMTFADLGIRRDQFVPPAGPQPPFGSTVGVTVTNVTLPDCNNTPYSLHSYFNKGKGVLVAMLGAG